MYRSENETVIQLVKILELTNRLALVYRNKVKNDNHKESDAEHSYQLCVIAWYLITTRKYSLSIEKVFKYALAHDLVEIYAGDVDTFTSNTRQKSEKSLKENNAVKRIVSEHPEFKDMILYLEDYRKLTDKESRFVYALDKIIPAINVYLFKNDRYFLKKRISFEDYVSETAPKVSLSPEIKELFNELLPWLKNSGIFPIN